MSSGYGGRGSSFSRGGSSKKVKHKKKDFHEHHVRAPGTGSEADRTALKDRTLLSLDRLGHQAFAPGSGYGMDNWMKNLGFLLADFEEKASEEITLPESYLSKKKEVMTALSRPPDTAQIDAQIAEAQEAERKVLQAIGRKEASYFGSARADLNRKRDGIMARLEAERAAIAKIKAQPRPGRLFQRFLGEKPPSTVDKEANVSRLEKEIADVESEMISLDGDEFQFDEGLHALEIARENLGRLESTKAERLQLAPEREEAARALSEEISKLPLPGGEVGQGV